MSGLATAVNFLEHDIEVEIIEADKIFGGRATSWLDEAGDMIDNALHVFFPTMSTCRRFSKRWASRRTSSGKSPSRWISGGTFPQKNTGPL
jgi:monoamine oxidase